MSVSPTDAERTQAILERVCRGDRQALEELFATHRDFLHQIIAMRMDHHLASRVDVSDVIQETHLQAAGRMEDFLKRQPMPFRLWLRKTALECLAGLYRKHVQAQARAVLREIPLPERSSVLLAAAAGCSTPSVHASDEELAARVRQAVAALPEVDREIVLMRNFEGLTNQETALALGIAADAARKRYTRALVRLRDILASAGLSESQS